MISINLRRAVLLFFISILHRFSTSEILKPMNKMLINSPESCVADMVEGVCLTHPNVKKLGSLNVLIRDDIESYRENYVTIVSGGGSGHEPGMAGFIGDGMISAAVSGNVFASPSVSSILAAIRAVAGPKGVLVIVMNYTGDRINFGMAIEKAKAEGINVRMVKVNDDCALSSKGITGARGIAGTALVHKLAGAMAAKGASLDEVCDFVEDGISRMKTLGAALTSCVIPGSTSATRLTADDPHYEVGLGIHGEPGRETLPLPTKHTAEAVATVMVSGVTEAIKSQFRREGGDSVVLLLNNLGALPVLELYVMAKELITQTKKKGLNPVRVFAGTYISSLNMNGISLTVLKLPPSSEAKQVMLECLDMPTLAPAWTATLPTSFATRKDVKTLNGVAFDSLETVTKGGFRCTKDDLLVIKSVCDKIIDSEPLLTEYDSKCGDGDCGLVMKAGAMGVLKFVNEAMKRNVDYDSAALCQQVAISISATMGGTSGGLLELCFRAMSASMSKTNNDISAEEKKLMWSESINEGVNAIMTYGGAKPGFRTMLDAFVPAVEALKAGQSIKEAAEAAVNGAERTKIMESLAGRSNYISQDQLEGVPDPGAVAVSLAFETIANSVQKR